MPVKMRHPGNYNFRIEIHMYTFLDLSRLSAREESTMHRKKKYRHSQQNSFVNIQNMAK